MIFSVCYVILLCPVSYIMSKGNLRTVCLIGASLTCIGSWIKVFSVSPDSFVVTFIGQTFVASSQIIVLTAPPNLAAQWFGSDEIATATALGTIGLPIGVATLSLLTPILVKDHENLDDVGNDIYALFWGIAIVCTFVVVLMFICEYISLKVYPNIKFTSKGR